jgi:hypothetical protein
MIEAAAAIGTWQLAVGTWQDRNVAWEINVFRSNSFARTGVNQLLQAISQNRFGVCQGTTKVTP